MEEAVERNKFPLQGFPARLGFSRGTRGGSKQSCPGPLRKDRRRAGGGGGGGRGCGGWGSNLLEKGAPLGAGEV